MKSCLPLLFLLLPAGLCHGQKAEGDWYGSIKLPIGDPLPIVFHLQKNDKGEMTGTWDSPKQNAFGLSFSTLAVNGDSLLITIENIKAGYRGKWVTPDSIAGTWQQGFQSFPLGFTNKTPVDETTRSGFGKDVSVKTRDSKEIQGSLVGDNKEAPLVIIVAGSGPTDRDGNQGGMTTNSSLMIARALDSAKINSFRYDKRGIAHSTPALMSEHDLRFDTYVNDLIDIIGHFKELGYKKILVAGHSEGSLIGLVAANKINIDGLISISGAGLPADSLLKNQFEKQPLSASKKQEVFDILSSLKQGKQVPGVSPDLNSLFRESIQPYLINWFTYDPRNLIHPLNCPILILGGTCDIQVDATNATALFNAAPANSRIEILQGMTHTIKNAGKDCKDQMKTYSDGKMPLASGFMKYIIDFIKQPVFLSAK